MDKMEKAIWASAFANKFMIEWEFQMQHKGLGGALSLSGFSCAEVADVTVEKYREAMTCDDAEDLLLVKEKEEVFKLKGE